MVQLAQTTLGVGAFCGFISALWQHSAAVSVAKIVSITTYNTVAARTGAAAITLVWLSDFIILIVYLGIVTAKYAIALLAEAIG